MSNNKRKAVDNINEFDNKKQKYSPLEPLDMLIAVSKPLFDVRVADQRRQIEELRKELNDRKRMVLYYIKSTTFGEYSINSLLSMEETMTKFLLNICKTLPSIKFRKINDNIANQLSYEIDNSIPQIPGFALTRQIITIRKSNISYIEM